MALDSKSGNTILKLWRLMHQVRDILVLCEDSVFAEYRITTEQFSVLAAVKSRDGSLRPSDLAYLLERSPNSISMLVDRMVKAGLVRRVRDRRDRRVVNVYLTSKGEGVLKPAMPASWEFIQKILSPMQYEDVYALASLLETVKCELLGYLNPEVDMAEIIKNSTTNQPGSYERVIKNIFPSGYKGKLQSGKKEEGDMMRAGIDTWQQEHAKVR